MVGIAFDFRYGTVANASEKTAADAAVGAVGFLPAFNRVELIFSHGIFTRRAQSPPPLCGGGKHALSTVEGRWRRFVKIVDELGHTNTPQGSDATS